MASTIPMNLRPARNVDVRSLGARSFVRLMPSGVSSNAQARHQGDRKAERQ